jgi:hypothetical protein
MKKYIKVAGVSRIFGDSFGAVATNDQFIKAKPKQMHRFMRGAAQSPAPDQAEPPRDRDGDMMKFSELDRELAARMHGRNFYDQRPCEASARNGNLTMLPMTPSNVVLRCWLIPSLENIFKIQRCNTV